MFPVAPKHSDAPVMLPSFFTVYGVITEFRHSKFSCAWRVVIAAQIAASLTWT